LQEILSFGMCTWICGKENDEGYLEMRKDKIRILHIAQAAGGVDRYIRMLLKYLDKEKFENILVCSQDFREEDYKNLVDFFEQVKMDRAIGSNDLKAIGEVRRLIKRYNPDIVYAHSSKAGAIARVADIGLKNHCLYNPHGWAFNMRCSAKKKAMYTAIEKIAAPFCDKIICISDAEKQSALDKKICREDKLQVIFNGVDIEAYENGIHGTVKRKDLNIPEDAFVVGMVGRISPQKAPDIFIKMAKHVKDKVSNAHFIIVGNGDQEAEIKKYAKDNDFLDSLHITGWVDNPMSYVELFDVACLLSRWEGFGLVLPEYMMARKPIVASRVDAIPNIICDGENGLLVEMDDVVGASTAVLKLYLNNSLKSKLIDEGLKTVYKKFDAQRMTRETEKLFEEVTR
jgi:glycosyltransferase involved in cell wall biosynthesis